MTTAQVNSLLATETFNVAGEQYTVQDRLEDGSANFLYRVRSSQGDTYILKHAEPFIRTNPGVRFPSERMDFEASILQQLPTVLPADDIVNPVQVIAYESPEHNMLLSDGGPSNLKAIYSNPDLDIQFVARHLGQWLANLHSSTHDLQFGDNKIAKHIYRHNYNGLANTLKGYDLDSQLGEAVNEQFGSLIAIDDGCVCHGDFWPGNVIVKLNPTKLTIIDWEMSRRGNGVTDVGQFSAESWLLDRFRGGRGLLDGFLEAYVQGRKAKLSESDLQRIVIQFGTHISFWPAHVNWAGKEETAAIIKTGAEYLQRAMAKDWNWLQGSNLKKLFI
jgi:Phosphotransferase enzyme family